MPGETTDAWRTVTVACGGPSFLIVDGAPGLEAAIAATAPGWPPPRKTILCLASVRSSPGSKRGRKEG